jgi:hypothetical protein
MTVPGHLDFQGFSVHVARVTHNHGSSTILAPQCEKTNADLCSMSGKLCA